ncbi:MAG: NUDIX domain-containing protein [Alphaproteobacteria bacterium]|nr:NUDIX domain-containing protein [Rickettsiales bacterium]
MRVSSHLKLSKYILILWLSMAGLFGLYKALPFFELLYLKLVDSKVEWSCNVKAGSLDGLDFSGIKFAGCMIEQDDSILMIEGAFSFEDFNRWKKFAFPAGTVIGNEEPSCTAVREVAEETGVAVEVIGFVGRIGENFALFLCKPLKRITEDDLKWKKLFEVRKLHFVKVSSIINREFLKENNFMYPSDIEFLQKHYS